MGSKQAESYKNKGNDLWKQQKFGEAIENYTYAIECDPSNFKYYTNRATCYASMQKWDKVLRDGDKAIKLDPTWVKGWYRRGQALFEMGHFKEATEAFKKAVDLQPENGDFKEWAQKAEKQWKKDFTPAMLKKDEGNAFVKLGKIPEAVEKYTEALDLCGENENKTRADVYNNRAHCYVQLYEPKKVVADCNNCLELFPDNVKALLRRGNAFESLEKYKKALADFERVIMLDPSVTMAQTKASRLRKSVQAGHE